MESSPLHLLFLLGYCLALIEGELRCHCNESGCVATGYMCKSRAGQCFTSLEARGEVTHLTHGCLDSLPVERRAQCQRLVDPAASSPAATATHEPSANNAVKLQEKASSGKAFSTEYSHQGEVDASAAISSSEVGSSSGGESAKSDGGRTKSSSSLPAGVHHHLHQPHMQQQYQQHTQNPSAPVLLCCTEDMCNYREDADITVNMNMMPKLNFTYQRGGASRADDGSVYARDHHSARRRDEDADRDLWFKAAVIAVPIAGGFILVLLVLLAVRMLRSDSTRHRRLVQIRRERSLTKAQMYISEHFMGGMSSSSTTGMKSKLHHCSLFDEKLRPPRENYSVYSEKIPPSSGSSNRDGNIYGSAASTGSGDNSNKVVASSGNIIYNGGVGVGHNSRGVYSPAVCCTDQQPCCGGLCSVQRQTQIRHCETCNNKRRSRSSCNCNCCCSKMCHTDCAVSPRSRNSIGDIKTSISSCSSSTEGINNPIHPVSLPSPHANHGAPHLEPYPVHQTPRSFSPGLHMNHGADFVSRDSNSISSEISTQYNPATSRCDHSVRTPHSQAQERSQQLQHSHSQLTKPHQYRALVAHWDKTNSRAPTAVV